MTDLKETLESIKIRESELEKKLAEEKAKFSEKIKNRQSELEKKLKELSEKELKDKLTAELKEHSHLVELEVKKYLTGIEVKKKKIEEKASEKFDSLIAEEEKRFKTLDWLF